MMESAVVRAFNWGKCRTGTQVVEAVAGAVG